MANQVDSVHPGFFSILRWSTNTTRDEAKNVAVLLVGKDGEFGGMKHARVSAISPQLGEQGLVDAFLVGLDEQFSSEVKPGLETLQQMHASLDRSLYLTRPEPTAVFDPEATLEALYKAYVMLRGGPRRPTKSVVMDTVIDRIRRGGLAVKRTDYLGDFVFDAIVARPGKIPSVVDILSFATSNKDWAPAERDAGHFLYGLEHVKAQGIAVIRPPADISGETAYVSHQRITKWFKEAGVPVVSPEEALEAVVA